MRRGPTGLGNPHETRHFWPAFRDPGAGQPPEKEVVYDPRCDPTREMEYRRNRMSQMCCALKECFKQQVRFEKSPAQMEPPFHARPFVAFTEFYTDWSIVLLPGGGANITTTWIGFGYWFVSIVTPFPVAIPPYLVLNAACPLKEIQARHRVVITSVGFDVTSVPENALRWSFGTADVDPLAWPIENQPPRFLESDDQNAAIPWPPPINGGGA